MKFPRKCDNYEAQPSRGNERGRDEEQTMPRCNDTIAVTDIQRRAATDGPSWNGQKKQILWGLTHLCRVDSSTSTVWPGSFPILWVSC